MEERCQKQLEKCQKRFERGAETFAALAIEIAHLKDKDLAINGTSKENRTEILERVTFMEKEVNQIKLSFATATNRILAGIAVACILLVIDILTRMGG